MGEVIQFQVAMKSASRWAAERMGNYGVPAIRLQPLTPEAVDMMDLPPGTTWAWAIVQLRPGQTDALLCGGTADSQSSAEDQARKEFARQEKQWAQLRAGAKSAPMRGGLVRP